MQKFSSSTASLSPEYGIEIGRWTQYSGTDYLPFGAMWCVIPPNSSSQPDQHPEIELAVVVEGDADFDVAGRREHAPAGSAILLGSEEGHVVHNRSADDRLVLLSMYWLPEGARDAG
ncbi:cupin domain-containing protein [Nonomuraea sp. NPDC050783]|uniref:cupin domain-containing protein n=1 Tax=Nonomuraea sp. NPDC050783 TaxID=3154634 RepID=UPI0034664F67